MKASPVPKGSPGVPRKGWTLVMLAIVLGTNKETLGRYLSGERYPEVRMMKRIEAAFGWPAREQVDLVPVHGYDLRYGMVLRQVLDDWKANNPRDLMRGDLKTLVQDTTRGPYSQGQLERYRKIQEDVTKITPPLK